MEQQGIRIECLSESLAKLGQHEKVYPWLSVGIYPGLPFGYLYGGVSYEIHQTETGGLLLKKTYTSQWKRLLLIILTGGIGSQLFGFFAISNHVKQYDAKEIKKLIRVNRSFSSNSALLTKESENNPPPTEVIYHMFVEPVGNKIDVHVFKLPTYSEEAQEQIDNLIRSVVPTDSIVDEEI